MTKKQQAAAGVDQSHWPFGKRNYIIFAIAMVVTIFGFILLGAGDITFAPILLVVGYCVLMPIAIIVRDKSVDEGAESESPPGS